MRHVSFVSDIVPRSTFGCQGELHFASRSPDAGTLTKQCVGPPKSARVRGPLHPACRIG